MRISVTDFLTTALPNHTNLNLIAGEANFCKHYRVEQNGLTFIIMDVPPEHENTEVFSQIAMAFSQAGINVPEIIEDDLEHGYLLLSDFGDDKLQQFITLDPSYWLPICLDQLFDLQWRSGQHILELPLYDESALLGELSLFPEWLITELLGIKLNNEEEKLLIDLNRILIDSAIKQPQTWVHHDYHSRNLMKIGKTDLGIINFQNAAYGAITYDLVSLLKDFSVRYPKSMVREQLEQYYIRLVGNDLYHQDIDQFERDFDYMGLQRHLKILGDFSRLSIRDAKHNHLNDLPLVFDYIFDAVKKYAELQRYTSLFEYLATEFEQRILS